MLKLLPYRTVEEFFENEKPRKTKNKIRYYTTRQIARASGLNTRTIKNHMYDGTLEENFGITYIFDSFRGKVFFSEDSVRKLYENYIEPLFKKKDK